MHAPPRLFYGWYVVAGCFLALFMSYGAIYAVVAFFTTFERTFGASRVAVTALFSIPICLAASLGIITGRIVDRTGPRPMVLAGAALLVAGMVLASRATALWQIYLAYGLGVGLGTACIFVPVTSVLQHWFVRRRGLASGLALAGVGAGNLVWPPVAAALIRWDGWRTAFVLLGGVAAAGIAASALLVQASPEARGLRPDGDPVDTVTPPAPETGETVRQAVRSHTFRLFYAGLLIASLGAFVPFAHLVPDAEAHGIAPVRAAWLLGLVGAGSVAGRLLLGGAADRLGRRLTLIGAYAIMASALAFWLIADTGWSLAVFAIVFGVGYGIFASVVGALSADYFGVQHAGAIFGVLATSLGIGSLIGPPAAGYLHDLRGSYAIPIIASVAMLVIATACAVRLPKPAVATTARRVVTPRSHR